MKYDLVIFDCDGTLVDTESVTRTVFKEQFRAIGIPDHHLASFDSYRGANMHAIMKFAKGHVPDLDTEQFIKRYRKRCNEIFEKSTNAIPGVESIVSALKVAKCIGSNAPHSKINVTLKSAGLLSYFTPDSIFSAYDIEVWKPAPDLYQHILHQYDIKSERALVIEDSLNGAMGAVNANIDVLVYDPDSSIEFKDTPLKTFSDMESIADYMRASQIL